MENLDNTLLEQMKMSKISYEADAYNDGAIQAKKQILEDPDYRFLCELNDAAKVFADDGDIDINYIDLADYPAALRYHVIKGFYDTVANVAEKMREVTA